jgi:hypothetical protein
MSSFLRALSKIGLIELDDGDMTKIDARTQQAATPPPADEDELEKLPRETQAAIDATGSEPAPSAAPTPTPATSPSTPPPVPTGDASELEGRELAVIYASAGIPESPFTVEKLVKVLEGLRALPAASRKAAVLALDAADDNWSIADVILDAQRKGRALREEQGRLSSLVSQAEAQAGTDLQAADEYLQAATAHIRQQISELEATLAGEVQQVTEQKAEIKARLSSTRDAASREHTRLESEVNRISQIPLTFSDSSN